MRLAWIPFLLVWCAHGQTAVEKQRAAAALQRESIQKQMAAVGIRPALVPATIPGAAEFCDPVPELVVAPLIEGAANVQKIEPKLLRAVIEKESAFRPCAISPAGAQGLMQLMPATAQELGVDDPFDPKQNIDGGAKFLKQLLDKYNGDLGQALGAYNAGPGTVDRSGGVPNFPETQNYVKSILEKLAPVRTDIPEIQMPKPVGN